MPVTLQDVERVAPDQASLKAAAGLARPGKWSGLGSSSDAHLIWGECAGSGSSPYRVMADLRDLGNKCTCPSRKFPCKHVLALLWISAESAVEFPGAEVPEWVTDWLGRRRGSATRAAPSPADGPAPAADLAAARAASIGGADDAVDEAAAARRESVAARRAEQTAAAIADGLQALEQWVGDQLRQGVAEFVDDVTGRCRRIASRLVDSKAAALAGRVDELPGLVLELPRGDRVRGAVVELGKLVMLARAYRADPDDPEVRRAVGAAETRDSVMSDPAALRVRGAWEVVAETVRTRRDGLVAQTDWCLNLEADGPRFAMVQDFFPASAGRRSGAFSPGTQLACEMIFYPGRNPLRALVGERGDALADEREWPSPSSPLARAVSEAILAQPWASEVPVLLAGGRVAIDRTGAPWWRSDAGDATVPIAGDAEGLWRGAGLTRTAGLWSGGRLRLFAAQTPWGRVGAA